MIPGILGLTRHRVNTADGWISLKAPVHFKILVVGVKNGDGQKSPLAQRDGVPMLVIDPDGLVRDRHRLILSPQVTVAKVRS